MKYADQFEPIESVIQLREADDNPGTEGESFLTIQTAADVVEPAEKVVIKSGIYRELIRPRRGLPADCGFGRRLLG